MNNIDNAKGADPFVKRLFRNEGARRALATGAAGLIVAAAMEAFWPTAG